MNTTLHKQVRQDGFTLIELMLAISMMLILMVGVNYVFRSASTAVGAGQKLNEINRDSASAQPLLFDSLRDAIKDPPCFIIASQIVPQFLNADDAKSGSNTLVPNALGLNPLELADANSAHTLQSPAIYNYRSHRADLLRFFARGFFPKRTADDGTYNSNLSSQDAFITITHAALPSNDLSSYIPPITDFATGGNPLPNYGPTQRVGGYASDWVLSRSIMLMKDASSVATTAVPVTPQEYGYVRQTAAYPSPTDAADFGGYKANMSPLGFYSPDSATGGYVQSSRFDLAGCTVDQFRSYISQELLYYFQANPNPPWPTFLMPNVLTVPYATYTGFTGNTGIAGHLWWNPLVYTLQADTPLASQYYSVQSPIQMPTAPGSSMAVTNPTYLPPAATTFSLSTTGVPGASNFTGYPQLARPQCNPIITAPLTAAQLSQMTPYFLQHCSQFIVEYAGDYMQQDKKGTMTGLGGDGQIDFYTDANGNRHIRWYGMPRSSTGQYHVSDSTGKTTVLIRGFNSANAGAGNTEDPTVVGNLNYFSDVIPLRDYYTMWMSSVYGATRAFSPPWEVEDNIAFGTSGDYGDGVSVTSGSRYACAWYNDEPSMVRILIKVDDPNNEVKDGPWYEYVFRLK